MTFLIFEPNIYDSLSWLQGQSCPPILCSYICLYPSSRIT
ncbi:hypothetical protein NC651_016465 [Populus alba x Populus x berolinensis]|nr:hypothetical protein NC651_016465 [Populus alba x Populus x berolinensis]